MTHATFFHVSSLGSEFGINETSGVRSVLGIMPPPPRLAFTTMRLDYRRDSSAEGDTSVIEAGVTD
jgi:hypothetical protein